MTDESDSKAALELPEVDFSNFVLSLAATAMVQLGMVADPETGETVEPNLPIAQHTIDTLALLREKTQGNLDDEEEKLLDSMIYELRMRFVEAGK
jgi:hypothetical protein